MKTTLFFLLSVFFASSDMKAEIFSFSWSKPKENSLIFSGGCTNATACNYDPSATFDDGSCCFSNCVEIEITDSDFPAEVGYTLFDSEDNVIFSIPANAAPSSSIVCLSAGCYRMLLTDEFGDGWNGATYQVSFVAGSTIISGGFENFPVSAAFERNVYFLIGPGTLGCTDPLACNYNPAATCNNGTCDYVTCYGCTNSEACNFTPSATFDDGSCCLSNCVELIKVDYVGDGWNGGSFEIRDSFGDLVVTGTLEDTKSYDEMDLCLEDGCYTIEIFGGDYPEEIEWSLIGVNDGPISGDGLTTTFAYFSVGEGACFGCTDPAACTFNPFAFIDDGSCIAGPCVAFDNPWTARFINPTFFPASSNFNGTLVGSTASQVGRTSGATGEDVWFTFVATTAGGRFTANSSAADLILVLLDQDYRKIKEVNLRSGVGLEALNTDELTAGQTYYVGVRNANSGAGTGAFTFTAARLRSGQATNPSIIYNVCGNLKTQWTGASQFNFHFEDAITLEDIYVDAPTTTIMLSTLSGLRYDRQYNLGVSSTFSLPNSLGVNETYRIDYTSRVLITTGLPPAASINNALSCSNYGPINQNTWITFNPRSCGVSGYQIELVNQNGIQAPIVYNHNSLSRLFRLSMIAGVQNGATYNVRVRPVFPYDYVPSWGPSVCIQVAGAASFWTISNNFDEQLVEATESEVTFAASAYPNPNNGEQIAVLIDSDEQKDIQIAIHDLTGRLVYSTKVITDGELNMELPIDKKLASGVYCVNFVSGSEKHTQRLIVRNN